MLTALLLALAAPAAAVEPAPAPATDLQSLSSGPFRTDAMDLVQATMPEPAFKAMMRNMLVRGLKEGLGDQAASLEKLSPGVLAEINRATIDASAPHIDRSYRSTLALYARLYSSRFTPEETGELATFYRSPIGSKLIAKKYGHLATGDLPETLLDPDHPATVRDIASVNRDVAKGIVGDLDPSEQAALIQLTRSPLFKKMAALIPLINKLEAETANEQDPEFETTIEKAMNAVLKRRNLTE